MVITAASRSPVPPEGMTDYEALIRRYAPMVQAWCARELCPADADDATQAVFLVLWQSRSAPASGPRLASWLLGVTRNVIRNAKRSQGRRRRAEQRASTEQERQRDGQMTSATSDASSEIRSMLNNVLAELPEMEREAVEMYYLAGFTYADIAKATDSKTSTIAARVQRGLRRLRDCLSKRGTVVPLALLVGLLEAEASADISPTLRDRLVANAPSAGTAVATTTQVPAHILRWSRQGPSLMTTLTASLGAGLLTVSALLYGSSTGWLSAADAQAADNDALANTATEPAAETAIGNIVADNALVFRFNDPQRSWERIKTSPYGAFLSAEMIDEGDRAVQGLGPGWLAFDVLSRFAPATRATMYESQQDMAAMSPEEIADETKRLIIRGQDQSIRVGVTADPQVDPELIESEHFEAGHFYDGRGQMIVADADQAEQLANAKLHRAFFNLGATGENSEHSMTADGTLVERQDETGSMRLSHTDGRLQWLSDSVHQEGILDWLPEPVAPRFAEADFEFYNLAKPHAPADYQRWTGWQAEFPVLAYGHLQITDTGMRLTIKQEQPAMPQRQDMRGYLADVPQLPTDAFTAVPADAFVAGVLALGNGDQTDTPSLNLLGILAALQGLARGEQQEFFDALTKVLSHASGHGLAYVQAGAFLPALTVIIPTPADTGRQLIAAAGQLPNVAITGATDADNIRIQAGPMGLHIGQRDDRLVLTSNVAGVDAVLAAAGGFTAHADVAEALAPLKEKSTGFIVIRNKALASVLAPYAQMGPPETVERLQAFLDDLPDSASWLRYRQDEDGMLVEGDGALNAGLLPLMGPIIAPALGMPPAGTG